MLSDKLERCHSLDQRLVSLYRPADAAEAESVVSVPVSTVGSTSAVMVAAKGSVASAGVE